MYPQVPQVQFSAFIYKSIANETELNSALFWNQTWQSTQWRALCTEITQVNLSAFVYNLSAFV